MVVSTQSRSPLTGRRILIVSHGYPPLQATGAELQIKRKADWWRAHGNTVRVITADPYLSQIDDGDQIEESAEELDGISMNRVRFRAPDGQDPLEPTYRHQGLSRVVEREISTFEPEVIYQVSGHLFGVISLEVAKRCQIPSVLFSMDYWHACQRITLLRPNGEICPGPRDAADCAACRFASRRAAGILGNQVNGYARKIASSLGRHAGPALGIDPLGVEAFRDRERAIRRSLEGVSLVVCNSEFLTGWMMKLGVPANRIIQVRQGIDAGEFSEALRGRSRGNDRDDGLNVLFLGQATRHKGLDLLVEATEALVGKGIAIQMRAYGPETDGDLAYSYSASTKPIAIGPPIDRPAVIEQLRWADVLVAPSRWYENSPNVILEAQAAGLPVVTADHGGMAEMVRHDVDGLLFSPGDAASLAGELRKLATEPGLLGRLQAGVVKPHGMSTEMMVEDRAIEHLLAGSEIDREAIVS